MGVKQQAAQRFRAACLSARELRAMKFSDYQLQAQETDQTPKGLPSTEEAALLIPLLGLAGEAGQLLGEYKKRLRDGPKHERFADRVAEELGDILWYAANLASKYNLDLGQIAEANLRKTSRTISGGL